MFFRSVEFVHGTGCLFYKIPFNWGDIYDIWQEFIIEPNHVIYVIEYIAHLEWCTGDMSVFNGLCFYMAETSC